MTRSEISLARVGLAMLAAVSTASAARAQFPGEIVYGPTPASEESGKRVISVTACLDGVGGFVTAGTSRAGTPNSDVYVVRTRLSGHRIWEFTYDVHGAGGADTGTSIAELKDGSGFVVTGSTNLGTANADVLMMKIGCSGAVRWATSFVSPAVRESGYDVIEARTGTPILGTFPGDLVVAGYTTNPKNQNADGLLIRTRSDGTLIWNRRYDSGGAVEFFRALTEARATGTPTGDIVTVGDVRLAGAAGLRALSFRVNGDSGLFTSGAHCAAARGAAGASTRFESVIELTASAHAGTLVMVGSTSTTASSSDLYLVRTAANPCVGIVQRRAGDPAAGPLGDEAAFDVREVLKALPIAPVGTLVLTGRAGRPATTRSEAFLHTARPDSLALLPGTGRLYGDHGAGFESASALIPFSNGFVLAGVSGSDFEGVGDKRDVYLVGTDGDGKTGCELLWHPPQASAPFRSQRLRPRAVAFLQQVFRPVVRRLQKTEFANCS